MSAKSNYNYKTDLEIWKENNEFECQNISRSRPPLDFTPVVAKMADPTTLTIPTESSKRKENIKKCTYQRIRSQTQVRQTRY